METLFVTGGSSTLGQHVLRKLVSRVHILAVEHKRTVELLDGEVERLHGGLEECVRHPGPVQAAQIVLHMAAVTHTDDASEYLRVNTELTKRLLSVCDRRHHFVYLSTICAHPDGGAYGYSKWLAEESIRASGLKYTIIRPSEIYGSKDGQGIDALITLACKTHILPDFRCSGSIKYSPISLDETAQFIADATVQRRRSDQTYTLCAQQPCTAPEMAQALRSSVRPLFVVPVPVLLLRAAAAFRLPLPFKRDQVDRLILPKASSNMDARCDYGFQPRPFLDYLACRQSAM